MIKPILSISALIALSPTYAEEMPSTPPDNWKCQSCPYDKYGVYYNEISAGAAIVSNDSAKFGDFNGYDEEGGYLLLDGEARYKNGDKRVEFKANDLGLDKRSFSLDAAKQGKYKIKINGRSIPRRYADSTRTPYVGGEYLLRPTGWVDGANTSNFVTLPQHLQDQDWFSNRKELSISFNQKLSRDMEYELGFSRNSKNGKQVLGAMLGDAFASGRAALILAPQDYLTNQAYVSTQQKNPQYQWSLRYDISQFKNAVDSIRWQNLFDNPASDAEGQAALPPDNRYHQLSLQGSYIGVPKFVLSAAVSFGQTTQDESFQPITVSNQTGAISATSLDGEIVNTSALLKALYRHSDSQVYDIQYRLTEQDNNTPRVSSLYVIADTSSVTSARTSLPYSFRTQQLTFKSRTKLSKQQRVLVGLTHKIYDRNYQAVTTGHENIVWAKFIHKPSDKWDYAVKVNHSKRSGDEYEPIVEFTGVDNALLRKYNLADREQNRLSLSAQHNTTEKLTTSLTLSSAVDDYAADLGLQEGRHLDVNLDLLYLYSNELTLALYISGQTIKAKQAGIESNSIWLVNHKDSIFTQGVGITYMPEKSKLSYTIDLINSNSTGEIDQSGEAFPDLEVNRTSLELQASYQYKEKMTIKGFYIYEVFDEKDWPLGDGTPNAIDHVLGLSEEPADYTIGLLGLRLVYVF